MTDPAEPYDLDAYDYDPATGYPLDPNNLWNRPEEEQARARERTFGGYMYLLKCNWRAGDITAPAEAVRICALYRQPPPPWLVDAVAATVDQRMDDAEKRNRRGLAIHMTRWEAVEELRERRHELFERHNGDDRGTSLERSFAAVAEGLAKTEARGGEPAIEASYKLIRRAGGEHTTLESYRLALPRRSRRADK
jgi:hypothetical protein